MSKGRYFCGGSALAVTLALTMGVPASYAQAQATAAQPPAEEAPAEETQDANQVEAVITTGTFIRGAAEDAAIPVEVLGRDELLQNGAPNIEEIARSLTEVGNVQSQSARGSNADGYGVSSINLRNMGSGRTLLTINGRRLADEPVSSGGAVNVTGGANQNANSVPMGALQQVEVLKGGGGAIYGSDAVAGVVNFVTRRDVNGIEVNADYKYVPDTDGDYHVNVLWGRRQGRNNVLLSVEYEHQSALAVRDRDFAVRNLFIQGTSSSGYGIEPTIGSYQFNLPTLTNGVSGSTIISSTAAGSDRYGTPARYLGAANPNAFPAISASGLMRDEACLQLGGYRTFSATPSPACGIPLWEIENIKDDQARWGVFGDANFDVTDTLRYHAEANFSKTTTIVKGLSFTVNPSCDPWPASASGSTLVGNTARACTPVNISLVGSSWSVPGFNPAVFEYLRHAYTGGPGTTGVTPQQVFSNAQIQSIAGVNPTTLASTAIVSNGVNNCNMVGSTYTAICNGVVSQGYVPVGYGRVTIPTTLWKPFMAMRNPAFKDDPGGVFQNQSISYRTTQELKGDLGEIWHNDVDFSLAVTYQRNMSKREGKLLLIDRLQRAMNGFATNLDDLGSDGLGCTAAETSGTRVLNTSNGVETINNVPYTVGAGGGTDYDPSTPGVQTARNGFNPGAGAAGNRCFFFNPFASAVTKTRIPGVELSAQSTTDPTQIGFIGDPTGNGGIDGNYQGYARGYGLINAPGIVKWMYQNREYGSFNDNVYIDLVFNGTLKDWELPGGPIGWAAGGQYRYVYRQALIDALGDTRINPCPYLSAETGGLTTVDNIINPTSNCTTTSGVFQIQPTNFSGVGFRETVNRAAFVELSLPLIDKLGTTFAARYEQARIPGNADPIGSTVLQGSAKYQLTPSFALRFSAGETFDAPNIDPPGQDRATAGTNGTTQFFTSIDNALINGATSVRQINNSDIQPETGFHYETGIIFQSPDRRTQANLTYFYNKTSGQNTAITQTTVARALLGLTNVGATLNANQVIDCSNPVVQQLFDPAQAPPLLGGHAIVEYNLANGSGTTVGCRAGVTTLAGVDLNGNGSALDAADDSLSINIPNRVNAASVKVSGLESNVTWQPPIEPFGGRVVVNADLTVNLFRGTDTITVFGVPVTSPVDDTGTLASGFAAQVNIWRGSMSGTWLNEKHSLTLRANYVGALAPLGAVPNAFGAGATPGLNQNNINPPDPSLCLANGGLNAQPLPIRQNDTPIQEDQFFTGDGPFNAACNLTHAEVNKADPQIVFGATWRYSMNRDTTFSVSVENLFDQKPPLFPATYFYNPFGSAGSEGRTVKFAINKKFPR